MGCGNYPNKDIKRIPNPKLLLLTLKKNLIYGISASS
jgi:hypothetical protein